MNLGMLILTNPIINTLLLSGTGDLAEGVLKTVATVGGALVGIALIISIVKDAMGYLKGSGSNSIGKIIGKVLLLIVLIGIITIAGNRGFDKLGQKAGQKADNVMTDVVDDIKK